MSKTWLVRIASIVVAIEMLVLWGVGRLAWPLALLGELTLIVVWDLSEPDERFAQRCERKR